MAFTKAQEFNTSDYHFSLLCKALSHPARIAILRKLMKHGKMRASEIGKTMPLSQPAVSQHLKVLHTMGIIDRDETYPNVYYWMSNALPDTYFGLITLVMQSSEK